MFTEEEINALYENVLQKMLRAGWVHEYSFTAGKGWHIGWTLAGIEHAQLLQDIVIAYGLTDDDRAPIAFDVVAQGGTFHAALSAPEIEEPDASFWTQSVAQLGLGGDELLIMVQIVTGWAPDGDTPVKFIP